MPRDISSLSNEFRSDGALRTRIAGELAGRLRAAGLSDASLDMESNAQGEISKLVVGGSSRDPLMQLETAKIAIDVLKEHGVTDFDGIVPLNPDIDPYAWNVVYKDGGWVING